MQNLITLLIKMINEPHDINSVTEDVYRVGLRRALFYAQRPELVKLALTAPESKYS